MRKLKEEKRNFLENWGLEYSYFGVCLEDRKEIEGSCGIKFLVVFRRWMGYMWWFLEFIWII